MKTHKQFLFILIVALFLLGNVGHIMLPQVFTNTKFFSYNNQAKSNLHNLYLACNDYWEDKGSSGTCTVDTASKEEYGFIQGSGVIICGSGAKNNFCAIAWHPRTNLISRINWRGTIWEEAEFFYEKFNKNPPNKIWIYNKLVPQRFIHYSFIFALPLMTLILTLWAGGYPILEGKRKFPRLIAVGVIVGWTFFACITLLAGNDPIYNMDLEFHSIHHWGQGFILFIIIGISVIFPIWRAFSLIGWGNQIERANDLPDYLKIHNAKKLKKSGIYLLGVIGVLWAFTYIYSVSFSKYQENYYNQSLEFSKEIEKIIPTDPSQFQKLCQSSSKTP